MKMVKMYDAPTVLATMGLPAYVYIEDASIRCNFWAGPVKKRPYGRGRIGQFIAGWQITAVHHVCLRPETWTWWNR